MDSYNTRSCKSSHHHQASAPSQGDLLSSTKLVADAAMSAYHRDIGKVDKGRTAGATADLLHAASQYGHLEDKPFGQYIEKAEDYLYQFRSSSNTSATTYGDDSGEDHPRPAPKEKRYTTKQSNCPRVKLSPTEDDDYKKPGGHGYVSCVDQHGDGYGASEGGGTGDYLKMAQGYLKNQGAHGGREKDESDGGGVGDYLKLAQGFMKKH